MPAKGRGKYDSLLELRYKYRNDGSSDMSDGKLSSSLNKLFERDNTFNCSIFPIPTGSFDI